MVIWIFIYSLTLFLFLSFFVERKIPRYINGLKQGEALLAQIQLLRYHQGGQIGKLHQELAQYKFYTSVLKSILEYSRNFGTSIVGPLQTIHQGVRKELRIDKQLRAIYAAGMLQFSLMTAVTWIFALVTYYSTGMAIGVSRALIIILWQGLGLALFTLYFRWFSDRWLLSYRQLIQQLYRLSSGISSGMAPKRVVDLAQLTPVEEEKNEVVLIIRKRLHQLLYHYTQLGQGISQDLQGLIIDLWDYYAEAQQQLNSKIGGIKFLIMAVFFLTSHLFFFFAIMKSFLIEEV